MQRARAGRATGAAVVATCVALQAAGCGGGGGGGGAAAGGPTPVVGAVVAGSVSFASVRVFQINPDRTLTLVLEGQTDADGLYSLTPTGPGPFLVLAGGGTFTDEATGQTRTLAAPPAPATLDDPRPGTLEALVGSGSTATGPIPVSITPLSSFAARRSLEQARTDPSALAEAAVAQAAQALGQELGLGAGVDPRGVVPLDLTDPADAALIAANPGSPAARLGAVLAGLSQAAETLGLANPLDLVDALAADFSDGAFNGQAGGAAVPLGGGALQPDAATTDLAEATETFLDDPAVNRSGTTSSSFASLTQAIATQDLAPPGVNKAPTLDLIADVSTTVGAIPTVALSGVGPGAGETQAVTVAAATSATTVVGSLAVTGAGSTRTLAFTAIGAGTATVVVTAQDDGGTAGGGVDTTTRTFTVTVTPAAGAPPAITSLPPTVAVQGFPYAYAVTVTGSPAPVVSATGLPGWLALAGSTLQGTPGPADVGSVTTVLVAASNALGTATQPFAVSVLPAVAPAITTTPPATARVGVAFSYTILATGTPQPTFAAGGLPPWLTLVGNTLSGTPGPAHAGVTGAITVTASNGVAPAATQTFSLLVEAAPALTSAPVTLGAVGAAYTYTITTTGTPAPTLAASGLPAWLSLVGSTLSGTPGPGDAGLTGTITVTASNGVAPSATQSFQVDVYSPPALTSGAPPGTATLGVPYAHTLTTTGNPAPVLSLSGAPVWLALSGNQLSGTPAPLDVGVTSTVTVTADNGSAPVATQTWTLVVVAPPGIASAAPTAATVGTPYTYAIVVTGHPAPALQVTGLPAWLTLSGATLSGTPALGDLGTTGTITVRALANGVGPDAVQTFQIIVGPTYPTGTWDGSPWDGASWGN